MGLNSLSTGSMVSLTGSLVEKGHLDRRALERIPAVAVLLPYLDAAHEALLRTQRNPEQVRLAGISAMQADMDRIHDRLARGVWHGMECYKFLVQDTKLAEKIGKAQGELFPDALKVVQYSYRETAEQGALLASRLGPEQEALLASLPVQGGSMLDTVHEWIATAERLGELENERTRLTTPLPPGSAARARSQWIRTIQAIRTMIELEGIEEPHVLRLLQRIADAASSADRRSFGGQQDSRLRGGSLRCD